MREEYDANPQDFQDNSMKGVHARFYWFPYKDEAASAEAGRPIFQDREFVELLAPGNSTNIVRRKVSDMDRRNFPQQYALFKQGDSEQMVGTPLAEWPMVTRSHVEELAYIKCRTVEQLAEINDAACNTMPGLYDLKKKAKLWLEKAASDAPFTAMAKENEELRARIAALEESMKLPMAKKTA
jgi:hypothetical protein